ncbi:MAG: insulinase family protein [Patescibacteria group bacterium]
MLPKSIVLQETINQVDIGKAVNIYRHQPTNMPIVEVISDDSNNTFMIGFKTINPESTGTAHILEHSVLSGSQSFPVKEPFLELIKTSVQTFLNAFTYPDRTVYPIASQNLQDHLNLMSVYLDAVFKPCITAETLAREGWHFHQEKAEDPITIRGVVFNEMKGVYSNFDSELEFSTVQHLLPDTVYAEKSGGNPKYIPDLTFDKFRDFYTKHYHPSNAIAIFYGNHDNSAKFELLAKYLDEYQFQELDVPTPSQPAWSEPRSQTEFIISPIALEKPDVGAFSLSWMLDKASNWDRRLKFTVLNRLLMDSASSPLWDKLSQLELGQQILNLSSGVDLDETYSYTIFSVAIKDIPLAKLEQAEDAVMQCLSDIADSGFSQIQVEAVLAKLSFELKELAAGYLPKGLKLGSRILETWFFDGSIAESLNLIPIIERIQAEYSANPNIFNELLQNALIQNQHRSALFLKPDRQAFEEYHRWEQIRIEEFEKTLTMEERQKLIQDTNNLIARNSEPDSEEDLAKIPKLKISDLAPKSKWYDYQIYTENNYILLHHPAQTNDITYVEIAYPIPNLQQNEVLLLGAFLGVLTQLGTSKRNYTELNQQISLVLGSLSFDTFLKKDVNGQDQKFVNISFKCLDQKLPEALDLIHEITQELKPEPSRIKTVLQELRASIPGSVLPENIYYLQSILMAQFDQLAWLNDQMNGINIVNILDQHLQDLDKTTSIFTNLKSVFQTKPIISCVCSNDAKTLLQQNWSRLFNTQINPSSLSIAVEIKTESYVIESPVLVNYNAWGGPFKFDQDIRGAAMVASNLISRNNLWNKVRVQGGAYGGSMQTKLLSNFIVFNSWRDPHLDETIDIFKETGNVLSQAQFTPSQIEAAIISTSGKLDDYQDFEDMASTILTNYLLGWSLEMEQNLRDQVLSCDKERLSILGEKLSQATANWQTAFITSSESAKTSALLQNLDYRLIQPFK